MSREAMLGQKTWGRWSARLALLYALVVGAALALFASPLGVEDALGYAVLGLLAYGAYRTLARLSGGLRLLCGAWGVALGLTAANSSWSLLMTGLSIVAAVGLALTVLHKEK